MWQESYEVRTEIELGLYPKPRFRYRQRRNFLGLKDDSDNKSEQAHCQSFLVLYADHKPPVLHQTKLLLESCWDMDLERPDFQDMVLISRATWSFGPTRSSVLVDSRIKSASLSQLTCRCKIEWIYIDRYLYISLVPVTPHPQPHMFTLIASMCSIWKAQPPSASHLCVICSPNIVTGPSSCRFLLYQTCLCTVFSLSVPHTWCNCHSLHAFMLHICYL